MEYSVCKRRDREEGGVRFRDRVKFDFAPGKHTTLRRHACQYGVPRGSGITLILTR